MEIEDFFFVLIRNNLSDVRSMSLRKHVCVCCLAVGSALLTALEAAGFSREVGTCSILVALLCQRKSEDRL